MLAFLILKRGRPVSRSALAFSLFSGKNEQSALSALRKHLYTALKTLPPRAQGPWLVTDGKTIRWDGGDDARTDVFEFERLVTDATTKPAAVDLYAGDLLENLQQEWVIGERERLRGLYLQALTDPSPKIARRTTTRARFGTRTGS